MNKEILLSLVLGLGVPMALMGLMLAPASAPAEETQALPTQAPTEPHEEITVTVLVGGVPRQMELESYLAGVVLAEMPADFETEALKAQAVVARTYTLKRLGGSKHPDAQVCTDPGCCQAYRTAEDYLSDGGAQASIDKVTRAVESTRGMVLTYEGQLIDATYFSCSGGQTEAAVEVWGSDVPYLQAVESPGEEDAAYFSDEIRFSPAEFAGLLGLDPGGDPSDWLGSVTRTEGGGVDTMVLQGREYDGTALRKALGLRSTAFTIEVRDGGIVIQTQGFGHRVGMSQYGAQAMAEEGKSCPEILAHYYQGTELQMWEGEDQE